MNLQLPPSAELIAFSILSMVVAVMVLGMLWSWGRAIIRIWNRDTGQEIERLRTLGRPSWSGLTLIAVLVLFLGVNTVVREGYALLTDHRPTGGPTPVVGRDGARPDSARPIAASPKQPVGAESGQARQPEQSMTELMLQSAVSNGLLLLLVPAVLRISSGATLGDMGLYAHRWPRQIAVGAHAAFLMTPPVMIVQAAASRLWPPNSHPVQQMILYDLSPAVAALAVLSAVILAPCIEELLFRALVQRWFARTPGDWLDRGPGTAGGPDPGSLTPVDLGETTRAEDCTGQPDPLLRPSRPGNDPYSPIATALPIVLTSLIFAAVHAAQWPAPIAIFVLSLGLGIVYVRTGSLLAAISMHGTFNGFNTLMLLWSALGQQISSRS